MTSRRPHRDGVTVPESVSIPNHSALVLQVTAVGRPVRRRPISGDTVVSTGVVGRVVHGTMPASKVMTATGVVPQAARTSASCASVGGETNSTTSTSQITRRVAR